MIVCSVPGCGRKISPANRATVCMNHNHRKGYCQCSTCTGRELGAVRGASPITLPKAPWDADARMGNTGDKA